MSDPRFARLHTDPRFRKPKKDQHKVLVDERFKSIFDDGKKNAKKNSKGGRVDKYGRRISDSHEKDNLRRFYRLDGEQNDASEQAPKVLDLARGEVLLESSDEEEDQFVQEEPESDDDGEVILGHHASKPIPVLADEEHLEVNLIEDDDVYADLDAQAAAYSKELAGENDVEESGSKSNRLAVVNLDWDHVRASHLYKIFSSLLSHTASSATISTSASPSLKDKEGGETVTSSVVKIVRGRVLSVRVYPSEFGKARMKKEEVEGPPKDIFKKSRRSDEDGILRDLIQEDEGDEYDEDALRKYQLERLRYYYAIVTCDTVDAASHLLSELDGTELERSANVLDLSFVPDEMIFDDEFRDEATRAMEAGSNYSGLDFSTDALRHSKVTLKWDEDDLERKKITRRALSRKEIEEGDYRAYIASSGTEDEDEGNQEKSSGKDKAEREKLRKLLLGSGGNELPEGWGSYAFGDDSKGEGGDMEITFMPGLSEANPRDGNETTLEKYKRKQKEKRQARKKEGKEQIDEQKATDRMKARGVKDDFFGEDSGSSDDEVVDDRKKLTSNRKNRSKSPFEARPATEAELELLVAPDDASEGHKHFDMKSILKAEKGKGRKKGREGKKTDNNEGENEMQEYFRIDVRDERFKALHEDHTFAIDPSNPHFRKSKSMAALLEERTKRQQGKQMGEEESYSAKNKGTVGMQSLQSLVESVKRKSSQLESAGKRRKL